MTSSGFGKFTEAAMKLAASRPRQEVTAATADQMAIADGIVKLGKYAEATAEKIMNRRMTRGNWNHLADAYKAIGDMAAMQGLEADVVDAPEAREIEGQGDANP